MIVVVGPVAYLETAEGPDAGGVAARIAIAAAGHGHTTQFVGKLGEDDAGDAVVLALARMRVGHVALLREAGRATERILETGEDIVDADAGPATVADGERGAGEDIVDADAEPATTADGERATVPSSDARPSLEAADVDLALRYLTDFAVLVLADRADLEMVRVVADAASWSEARLVVVVRAGEQEPAGLPPDAIVFEAPEADPDHVFASMVGAFAAALDDGDDPTTAFRATVTAGGWTASPEDEPARPQP